MNHTDIVGSVGVDGGHTKCRTNVNDWDLSQTLTKGCKFLNRTIKRFNAVVTTSRCCITRSNILVGNK